MAIFKRKKKANNDQENRLIMKNQAERIDELKKENAILKDELKRLQMREEGVADALALAKQKANEYNDEAKVRFSLECARLNAYSEKWKSGIYSLESASSLGQEVIKAHKQIKEVAEEIKRSIDEDFGYKEAPELDFDAETERIAKISQSERDDNVQMDDGELKKLIVQLLDKED